MSIRVQRIAATNNSCHAPEVVLLHGWGMSSVIWQPWLPLLREHCNLNLADLPGYGGSAEMPGSDVDNVISALLEALPQRAVYIGYSLGGMLANRIALTHPRRVAALITFSTNLRFVATDDYPDAMSPTSYQQFESTLASPAIALKRFSGLQAHGSCDEKILLKQLRQSLEDIPVSVLRDSLAWLCALDNRERIHSLDVPAKFCFAEHDALVPLAASHCFPERACEVVTGAAHAMFWSHPQACAELVTSFLTAHKLLCTAQQHPARSKQAVARSFGRAAGSYDSVAALQRQVGSILLKDMPSEFSKTENVVVDLGCGTGFFLDALQQCAANSLVVGLDLAEGMLHFARNGRKDTAWVCGDAENLPLADQSVSLVFSNLAVQWCENIDAVFAEVFRILKPGGRFLFSTLGPDTLIELREAWRSIDNYVHVNRFSERDQLIRAIEIAGFDAPFHLDQTWITLEYETFLAMARELKSLGAHNVNSGRQAGLTARRRLQQLTDRYESYRNANGQLPSSYQVWSGVLIKGEHRGG